MNTATFGHFSDIDIVALVMVGIVLLTAILYRPKEKAVTKPENDSWDNFKEEDADWKN